MELEIGLNFDNPKSVILTYPFLSIRIFYKISKKPQVLNLCT